MFDHIGIETADIRRSREFYQSALAALGFLLKHDFGDAIAFGIADRPHFWVYEGTPCGKIHIAFPAISRSQVNIFHQAALAAGGKDNGSPGLRKNYHPHYYGAFVLDPDGNNIEAVCHLAE